MKADFYLAHPLDTRHKVRDELQVPLQELGYSVRNPFYDEDLQPRWDVAELDNGTQRARIITPERARNIVASDLKDIDEVEAVVVYLPYPGIGTPMEIFYAGHVHEKQNLIASQRFLGHPWIQTYCDVKRTSIEDIIRAIILEEAV